MIKYFGNVVQLGFGAVGKSFFEKANREIKFDMSKYYVITKDKDEYENYMYLGGLSNNLCTEEVTKDNFSEILSRFLGPGDLLLDFADCIGTRDLCKWCMDNNIMYLNTGEADWPNVWYNILEENHKKNEMKHVFENEKHKVPIVLQHGNNPGLVSHFVKEALEYIVKTQFKKDKILLKMLKENKYNEIAEKLNLKMIHVNDIDYQKINEEYRDDKLVNTWSIESFFFELLSEAAQNVGSHENVSKKELASEKDGFIEYKTKALDTKCRTYCPTGRFEGYLVPHEETITISNSLTVRNNDGIIYSPSVMFIYSPCELARKYLENCKLESSKLKNIDNEYIVRGHVYPYDSEIVCKGKIMEGTEYVGVLLLGDKFDPVWVGNRVELSYLYKKEKCSYWQTPTITPVAMSALGAVCWMLKNKNNGGIYFPDDIVDYKCILKVAEKYISKTIYKTFSKEFVEREIKINMNNIQSKDFFVKEKKE